MTMPKRGYLLAALVVLVSIAALKMWAGGSWLGQGNTQSDSTAATAGGTSEVDQRYAQNPQAVSSETLPEADRPAHTDGQPLISGAFFDGKSNPQNGPQAVYSETLYDAGTVEAGADLTHTFRVKNLGKADLLIESVKPG